MQKKQNLWTLEVIVFPHVNIWISRCAPDVKSYHLVPEVLTENKVMTVKALWQCTNNNILVHLFVVSVLWNLQLFWCWKCQKHFERSCHLLCLIKKILCGVFFSLHASAVDRIYIERISPTLKYLMFSIFNLLFLKLLFQHCQRRST